MTREELLQNDSFWESHIDILLFNYDKGSISKKDFITDILELKKELINFLEKP